MDLRCQLWSVLWTNAPIRTCHIKVNQSLNWSTFFTETELCNNTDPLCLYHRVSAVKEMQQIHNLVRKEKRLRGSTVRERLHFDRRGKGQSTRRFCLISSRSSLNGIYTHMPTTAVKGKGLQRTAVKPGIQNTDLH